MATSSSSAQAKKANFNPFENWFSAAQQYPDFSGVRNAFSRNMEAVTAANQVALDCLRESTRRAMEIAQKNAQCIYDCSKDSMSCRNIEEAHAKSAEMVNYVTQNVAGHAKEEAERNSKAAQEILEICNKRMGELICEFNKNACNK